MTGWGRSTQTRLMINPLRIVIQGPGLLRAVPIRTRACTPAHRHLYYEYRAWLSPRSSGPPFVAATAAGAKIIIFAYNTRQMPIVDKDRNLS